MDRTIIANNSSMLPWGQHGDMVIIKKYKKIGGGIKKQVL